MERAVAGVKSLLALGALLHLISAFRRHGTKGVARVILSVLRLVPGVNAVIARVLQSEVKGAVALLNAGQAKEEDSGSAATTTTTKRQLAIPEKGVPADELLAIMQDMRSKEKDVERGNVFAYVYTLSDHQHEHLMARANALFAEESGLGAEHDTFLQTVYRDFMHGNALNPSVFPSLRRMEIEAVSMTADMLHGDGDVVGTLTSGGTESVLMAIKTYRDRAKALRPDITEPEFIAPVTIHPAFEKAAHYFNVKCVHIPTGPDYRADVGAVRRAITRNTILIAASAPQYSHGVVDPIPELSALALQAGLPLHVDACFGGFMLPWVEKLGRPVPVFDYRNPGVTSISADIHKYGYGPKGASVITYRNASIRQYQYFAYSQYPGGLFGSPSMAGTRPGGNIAQAWATLKVLGQDGYLKNAAELLQIADEMKVAVRSVPELAIVGSPHMTAFAFQSTVPTFSVFALADVMEQKGWRMERQSRPDSLHCTIMPHHSRSKDRFAVDIVAAAETVRQNPQLGKKGTAAMYGMMDNIPDSALLDDFIVGYLSEMFKL